MPTNLRLMNVKYTDDGNWFAEVWYGSQQLVGCAVTGRNGSGPEDVFLEPGDPFFQPMIAQLKGVPASEIDWTTWYGKIPSFAPHDACLRSTPVGPLVLT